MTHTGSWTTTSPAPDGWIVVEVEGTEPTVWVRCTTDEQGRAIVNQVMVHQPSASFYGQAVDIARHAQEIVKLKKRLNEIYARHTGQSVEAIEKLLDRDTYMTGEEAKASGLIDEVMERRPEAAETPG